MKNKDTAPRRRTRNYLPIDSCSGMSDPDKPLKTEVDRLEKLTGKAAKPLRPVAAATRNSRLTNGWPRS